MRYFLVLLAFVALGLPAFGQTLLNNFDVLEPDTAFFTTLATGSRITLSADTVDRVGSSGAALVFHTYLASLDSWGTYAEVGQNYSTPQNWSTSDTLNFWLEVTQAPVHPTEMVFRIHLVDTVAGGNAEELIYQNDVIIDSAAGWINLKVPLYARATTGTEAPDTTGFIHAPTSWSMATNDGVLDPSNIIGWRFVAVSTTVDEDSLTIKFDDFYRTGHVASPLVIFTGMDFSSNAGTPWTWGNSSLSVETGQGYRTGESAVKWVQGDEWGSGWTGWAVTFNTPVDLSGGWIKDSLKFYMKCDTGTGAMRAQFESANGKRGTVFSPVNDGAWHQYILPLREMVVQDSETDFDSTAVTIFGLMSEASSIVGKTAYVTEIWTGTPTIDVIPPSPPTDVAATGSNYINTITWTDTPNETGAKYNVYFSENPWTATTDTMVEDVPPYNIPQGMQFAQHLLRYPKVNANVTYYYGVTAKDSTGNVSTPAVSSTAVTSTAKGVPTISLTVPQNLTCDGDLSEWASITPIELNAYANPPTAHVVTNTSVTDSSDLRVLAYLAVDNTYLYVAFDVDDDIVSIDTTGTDYYQDSQDMFIGLYDWRGPHHSSYKHGTQPDYHLRFSMNRIYIDNDGTVLLTPGTNYAFVEKSITPGYTIEARIPWTAFHDAQSADSVFSPKEGMRIPIDFESNDNDVIGTNNARQGIMCYSPLNDDNSYEYVYNWTYTWIGDKTVVGVASPEATVANVYALKQNYPNPFNPSTRITYSLAKAGSVTLRVFDILGRQVATLVNGEMQSAGNHFVTFDGSNLRGGLASGVYFYRLDSGSFHDVKKMMLLK